MAGDPYTNGNAAVVSTVLPLFLCPTDDGDPQYRGSSVNYVISPQAQTNGFFGAKTSYDMSVRRYAETANQWSGDNPSQRRMFGAHSRSRLTDARDGTSNVTLLIHGTLEVRNGVANTWGYSKWVGNGIDLGISSVTSDINYWWCCPWTPPETSIPGRTRDWGQAGSQHVGGCFVALGDGSVRWLSENIDRVTRNRLAMIEDGNPIGEF